MKKNQERMMFSMFDDYEEFEELTDEKKREFYRYAS